MPGAPGAEHDRGARGEAVRLRQAARESSGETPGTKLHRTTYHYWFHLGESQAIRQLLGPAKKLPDFVGALLIVTQQQLDVGVAEGLGDLMKGAAGLVGGSGMQAGFERAPDGVQVAGARGREDPLAVLVIDGDLELPPAREAVLAGDDQLSVGQPGRGILATDLPQALLGFVPEVLEIGPGGN